MTAISVRDPQRSPTRINRREFLHYALGAGAALVAAESIAGLLWFSEPRPRENVDFYRYDPSQIPAVGALPQENVERQFYLINTAQGLIAMSSVCTYRGCNVRFQEDRFACPCCGSQYWIDGTVFTGPACHNLTRWFIDVKTANGARTTPKDGSAVSLQDAQEIVVHVDHGLQGAKRTNFDYCANKA